MNSPSSTEFDLRMLSTVIVTLSDLYSIEVQLSSGGSTTGDARSCTAAHANTVSWPTNLDDQHAHLWRVLLQMPVINLPNATTAPQFPLLLVCLLGSSTCIGICCLSWLQYLLSAVLARNPIQSTGRSAQAAAPYSGAASTRDHRVRLTSRCSTGNAAEQSSILQSAQQASRLLFRQGPPEHDGLDPLPSAAIRNAHAKGACVASNQRLPKLITIVRGAITGVYQDLQGGG